MSSDFKWRIELTPATVREVSDLFDVDLMNPEHIAGLLKDVKTFVDILYVLCRDEADKAGLTSAQFGESLDPHLGSAAVSLRDAIVAFKPLWRRQRRLLTAGP